MELAPLKLKETLHPHKEYEAKYNELVGIDQHKEDLLTTLLLFFEKDAIDKWKKRHHAKGITFVDKVLHKSPLILLSGEVGCGKTALANSIATPLAKKLDAQVRSFETPSDIRGGGHVGELSARITLAFHQVKAQQNGKPAIFVIDEADDLATSRDQMQAHHEDRAGVNVLIKEIDALEKDKANIAVIIITNRFTSIDPAVIRRASLQLKFERPNSDSIREVFKNILNGVKYEDATLDKLVKVCTDKKIPFSYSDLTNRIGRQAVMRAFSQDQPFGVEILKEIAKETEPSPLIIDTKVQ
ncbi:MAG: ATP-binding protein [Bacteroidetes bacterium]|nr:ATP-binding protein [Bacteroidota bacterium]